MNLRSQGVPPLALFVIEVGQIIPDEAGQADLVLDLRLSQNEVLIVDGDEVAGFRAFWSRLHRSSGYLHWARRQEQWLQDRSAHCQGFVMGTVVLGTVITCLGGYAAIVSRQGDSCFCRHGLVVQVKDIEIHGGSCRYR